MLVSDEPEILDGSRSWAASQAAFLGVPDELRTRSDVECTWYEAPVGDFTGAFALIQDGGPLEDLVGDVLQVQFKAKRIFVYCVGGESLETPIALNLVAFLRLANPSRDSIRVNVRPVVLHGG